MGTHRPPCPCPHRWPAARRSPACLGKRRLWKRRDDQVWKCCAIIPTRCVSWCRVSGCIQAQGSLRLDGAQLLPGAPRRPSITRRSHPPALSPTSPLLPSQQPAEKNHLHELEIKVTRWICFTSSRFQHFFLEQEQQPTYYICVWRNMLEIVAAA